MVWRTMVYYDVESFVLVLSERRFAAVAVGDARSKPMYLDKKYENR